MFGHHPASKVIRKGIKQVRKFKTDFENKNKQNAKDERMSQESIQRKSEEMALKSKQDRNLARQEGREYAKDVLSQKYEGLDPHERYAMQSQANKGIKRSLQSANRQLLGEQSQRGIGGRGGVGYEQQRELQKMGLEARQGVNRDLDKINKDLELKKMAAAFNIESGEASQAQLDKQLAIDELQLADERKRQRLMEDRFNQMFMRMGR